MSGDKGEDVLITASSGENRDPPDGAVLVEDLPETEKPVGGDSRSFLSNTMSRPKQASASLSNLEDSSKFPASQTMTNGSGGAATDPRAGYNCDPAVKQQSSTTKNPNIFQRSGLFGSRLSVNEQALRRLNGPESARGPESGIRGSSGSSATLLPGRRQQQQVEADTAAALHQLRLLVAEQKQLREQQQQLRRDNTAIQLQLQQRQRQLQQLDKQQQQQMQQLNKQQQQQQRSSEQSVDRRRAQWARARETTVFAACSEQLEAAVEQHELSVVQQLQLQAPQPFLQRQVTLCKDRSGHVGLRVQSISKGVFVVLVTSGSPAALAGLRFGDQILQINGVLVAGLSMEKVHKLFKNAPKDGIKVAVRDRPFERSVTLHKDSTGTIGFQITNGKITSLIKDSSAARNGLLTDHYVLEVNGQNVVGLSNSEVKELFEMQSSSLTVTIMPAVIFEHMMSKVSSGLIKKKMDHSIPEL